MIFLNKLQEVSVYRKLAKTFQPKMQFIDVQEKDVIQMPTLSNPSTETHMLPAPNVTNIIAKKKSTVIASVQLVRRPATSHFYSGYWLFGLMVKPVYRGMGIGKKLSLMVIDMAMNEGADELFLQVDQTNQKAIKLYQHLGFNRKHIPALEELLEKEVHLHGWRRIIMSKSFRDSPDH